MNVYENRSPPNPFETPNREEGKKKKRICQSNTFVGVFLIRFLNAVKGVSSSPVVVLAE